MRHTNCKNFKKRLGKHGIAIALILTLGTALLFPAALSAGAAETPEVTQGVVSAFRDTALASVYPEPGTPEDQLGLPSYLNATVDGESVRIPVDGWISDPPYTENGEGPFVFTPVLPGGMDLDGNTPPTVMVVPGGSTGANIPGSVVEAADEADLAALFTDPDKIPPSAAYTIKILNDVTLTEPLTVPNGKTITLTSGAETQIVIRRGFETGALFTVPLDPDEDTALYISDLTISGEGMQSGGSLISNSGLTVIENRSRLVDNNNITSYGGAIHNKGTLQIADSEITDNTASSGSAVYNAGSVLFSGSVLIPGPGGLAIASEDNIPSASQMLAGSVVGIERTGAFSSSADTVLVQALANSTLSENDWEAFSVCGGGFEYSISPAKDKLLAAPIHYSVQYHFDETLYSNPSANLSKLNVFSPVLNLMAPSSPKNTSHFLGWYTQEENGTRVDIISPQTMPDLANNTNEIHLYARFADVQPETYTIVYSGFDTSKHQNTNPASYIQSDEGFDLKPLYTVSASAPDSTFAGWFSQPDGGDLVTAIHDGNAEELTGENNTITLYARWLPGSPMADNPFVGQELLPDKEEENGSNRNNGAPEKMPPLHPGIAPIRPQDGGSAQPPIAPGMPLRPPVR